MALILPRGVFLNSPDIAGSIERINAEPLDLEDIAKFWKVYTTTKRRLLDPTAERLENYWWRIWGSQRRDLHAATIARLFALISDGQSFVPLRGPANRFEGSPPLSRATRQGSGAASTTTLHRSRQSKSSTASSSTVSRAQAQMPHPILKKTRGPSSTGPRPTARFISPHESDAETVMTTNSSNGSTSPTQIVVQPPSPDSQKPRTDKKAVVASGVKKKGRLAVATAAKKRPVITRRQGSLSSTESAAKAEAQNADPSFAETVLLNFSQASLGKGKEPSMLQEDSTPEQLRAPSSKYRPFSKSTNPKATLPRRSNRRGSSEESAVETIAFGEPGPSSSSLRSIMDQKFSYKEVPEDVELQQTFLEAANIRGRKPSISMAQQLLDENEGPRLLATSEIADEKDLGRMRFKSAASLASTLADATGQLNLSGSNTPPPQETNAQGHNEGTGKVADDMFAKRPLLPAPGNETATRGPDSPLARSKSQLTLLLQSDRSRSGQKRNTGGKKKG